ncbi:MAG: hypothetical protein ACTSWQ_08665 [Candidatus Thorarchaeota archaeon]
MFEMGEEFIRIQGLDPNLTIQQTLRVLLERDDILFVNLMNLLCDVADGRELINPNLTETQINLIFNFSLIFGSIFDNRRFTNALANLWAKVGEAACKNHGITKIAKDLYIKIKFMPRINQYRISVFDFVELISCIDDPHLRLTNNILIAGVVRMTERRTTRMIREVLRERVVKFSSRLSGQQIKEIKEIDRFSELIQFASSLSQNRASNERLRVVEKFNSSLIPPCVATIVESAQSGHNLRHSQRLALSFYLINKGAKDSEILDIFCKLPDYSRKITLQQITHARNKGYVMFSCKKLDSFGLCRKTSDEICRDGFIDRGIHENLKNPLQWDFWASKRAR